MALTKTARPIWLHSTRAYAAGDRIENTLAAALGLTQAATAVRVVDVGTRSYVVEPGPAIELNTGIWQADPVWPIGDTFA